MQLWICDLKFGGFDVYHKRIDLLTNSIQTSSEMIGIGGTLLQGHFEAIMRGGLLLRVGEPNRLITPLVNGPPNEGHVLYIRRGGGGVIFTGKRSKGPGSWPRQPTNNKNIKIRRG